MSRIRNIQHACKICGAKVKGDMRFCKECDRQRKRQRANAERLARQMCRETT